MGFFTDSELKKNKIEVDPDMLISNCKKCKINPDKLRTKVDISGEGKKKILIVGGCPTSEEDLYGNAFIGEEGFFLAKYLKKHGIILNKDCWKVDAVRCRPANGLPTNSQIQSCYPWLKKKILELKPTTIVLFGAVAITSLLGKDFSNRTVNRWRMACIPDNEFKCNIIPLPHPHEILRNEKDKNSKMQLQRDLDRAAKYLIPKPFPPVIDYESFVTKLTDFKSIVSYLKKIIKKKPTIAYDYETTGLKPYRKGHKIATIGIATSPTAAAAFPFNYKNYWTKEELSIIRKLWKRILKDDEIKKIAHNWKFESLWSKKMFHVKPKCHFDTMMAAHILDNRSAYSGLKFQTYINFGVRPYDDSIAQFLKSKNGEFNTVEKAPFKDLLTYNGLDCIFTFMLYEKFIPRIVNNRGLLRAYNFFIEGLNVMGDIQHNGIPADMSYYVKTDKKLDKKIKKLKKYLTSGREARAFEEKYSRPIKITSNKDLGKLFFDVLGKDPVYTDKGSYKTDKTTLESLNLPFVEKLLKMKKYEKAKGTYVAQFFREIVNNKIHPFFDLHIPVSYRSSSSMPNWQNLPKRDPEIGDLIRKGITPLRDDDVLIEADFGGAEVITSASYHNDPTFIYDVQHGDMHKDLATELWMLPKSMLIAANYKSKVKKKLAKMIRFFAKNNWTFAQFYGDYFGSCAKMLWENVIDAGLKLPTGETVEHWINNKGIYELGEVVNGEPTPGSFMEHCKNIEKRMWTKRFPLYTKWKKDTVKFYQEHGFIKNHFGFRFTGYMSPNQCCNFPIQSASFHILVHALIKLNKWLKKNPKLRTSIIGQIHDSIIMNCPRKNVVKVLNKLNSMVNNLQNEFKWLPIPMTMDYELSETKADGGNFAEMTEIPLKKINVIYKQAA